MKSKLTFLFLIILCSGVSLVYGQKPLRKPVQVVKQQKVQQPKQRKESVDPLILSVSGTVNGHDYVDLGLSVKWATCNVGAKSPEEYGDYYAWGEINTKADYSPQNSKTYKRSISSITGYPTYDVACAKWGKGWRLPTEKEIMELINECKTSWAIYRGVNGCLIKRNGHGIFLPAAGYRYGMSLHDVEERGNYWSSTPNEDYDEYAYRLYFNKGNFDWSNFWNRYYGISVRPVRD